MSNRFVYFYRVEQVSQLGSVVSTVIASGIAQLERPVLCQADLDKLRGLIENANPEMAPIKLVNQLTYLHRENVVDEQ